MRAPATGSRVRVSCKFTGEKLKDTTIALGDPITLELQPRPHLSLCLGPFMCQLGLSRLEELEQPYPALSDGEVLEEPQQPAWQRCTLIIPFHAPPPSPPKLSSQFLGLPHPNHAFRDILRGHHKARYSV